jgi:hypothetical protein
MIQPDSPRVHERAIWVYSCLDRPKTSAATPFAGVSRKTPNYPGRHSKSYGPALEIPTAASGDTDSGFGVDSEKGIAVPSER